MSSCNSSNATDFKESLDKSERKAFDIIVGKKGSGEKKLEYLEKEDYKNAIKAVNQQAIDFDIIIADISKLSTNDIPEGQSLKTASLEYYESLKELHIFDKKQIEQQAILKTLKKDELDNALNKRMELARQKKMLYNALYKKEALLHAATERFKAANGI
ncbi:hypothetical protein [Flavobacterium hibisci]|uniref:hypothetical protein n=1 Tax=Flavobacterium hibisci TaxID=1914462 RepID=UPI001CC190E9|nr:hypothetical protein [Flavobacterium hibisci]MBZ4040996.1 hypothetical protein [Flavobacterium hibisci]